MTFKDISYFVILLNSWGLTDTEVVDGLICLEAFYCALINYQSARGGEDGNEIN